MRLNQRKRQERTCFFRRKSCTASILSPRVPATLTPSFFFVTPSIRPLISVSLPPLCPALKSFIARPFSPRQTSVVGPLVDGRREEARRSHSRLCQAIGVFLFRPIEGPAVASSNVTCGIECKSSSRGISAEPGWLRGSSSGCRYGLHIGSRVTDYRDKRKGERELGLV